MKKITVVGTGYVGLVTGTCLSNTGLTVSCVDVDKEKIDKLDRGEVPIYEPGLDHLIYSNVKAERLSFTTSLKDAIKESDIIFIAVGTPPNEDGSADLHYVLKVAEDIGNALDHYAVVIVKSTVPVGTCYRVQETIKKYLAARGVDIRFDIASNPEFLKEGKAIDDFLRPDRIVVGIENKRAKKELEELYHSFILNGKPIHFMSITSSELTKYAANAMLATRISFMNELSGLCDKLGADIQDIRKGIGSDPRIGSRFLYAGTGYGGSCFPKDVKALIQTGKENNTPLTLLETVDSANERQKGVLLSKIDAYFQGALEGKTFALWGLAFKPDTDDMREAPSIVIAEGLLKAGAKVKAFDPVAQQEAERIFKGRITLTKDMYEAVKEADALVIVTEWNEFRNPDFEKLQSLMKNTVIFDGRNLFDLKKMKKAKFRYFCIGRQG